jgi:NodT family efflux transporter outer membrane factor (OMF) lipoprotein
MKTLTMKPSSRIGLLVAATLVSSCAIWPEYQRPATEVPAAYKEAATFPGWKIAEPGGKLVNSNWWKTYQDNQLENLIQQAAGANQSIRTAEANYRQAEALSKSARSALYPSLSTEGAATRSQRSSTTSNSGQSSSAAPSNSFNVGLTAGWEVDLWGRIRRGIESGDAKLAASAADLAAANLSVQTMLAQDYFQLRTLDTQQKLLNDTVATFEKSLKLTSNRYAVGLASRTDVAQSEAQLKSTQAQATDNIIQRTQLEHAIAVLIGKPPAEFSLPAIPFAEPAKVTLPTTPTSLPSELLERRPDIAAAERRAAAANAEIGIAKAALFPSLNLGANLGYQSARLADLLTVPSRVWSLGPLLAWSLFDGGQRKAQTDAAIAVYDATVSDYKQTVLNGFQEVEDNLAALRLLEQEAAEQEAAVKFARESLRQTENRYKAGTVDYLSVVIIQATVLSYERNALAILGRRLTASVGLFKALGGSSAQVTASN